MMARWCIPGFTGTRPVRTAGRWLVAGILTALMLAPADVLAQRPFRFNDPFYRGETARRDFYDRFALTGEISYRSAGTLQDDGGLPASNSDLALRFRFDYEITSRLDAGAVFDAVGANGGRTLSLSWLMLKYYRYLEQNSYAFRLAVDPASDGRVGFPQVDVAFLYTSMLSPIFSSDFAMGVRRVNVGYAQFIPAEPLTDDGPFVIEPRPSVTFTRALGSELHLMLNYNIHFDPAGSNVFFGMLGEASQYELVETPLDGPVVSASSEALSSLQANKGTEVEEQTTPFRGGVLWARGGLEIRRPNYQLSPFVSLPLQQWSPEASEGDWPHSRLHFGVRLMLR